MPFQNRVAPTGALHAVTAKGTLMGNRGIIHDDESNILRTHAHQNWVTCALHYKDRKQAVMAPGRYTQLFFLDEVTALSAGHRPCATCRRERYRSFIDAWCQVHGRPETGARCRRRSTGSSMRLGSPEMAPRSRFGQSRRIFRTARSLLAMRPRSCAGTAVSWRGAFRATWRQTHRRSEEVSVLTPKPLSTSIQPAGRPTCRSEFPWSARAGSMATKPHQPFTSDIARTGPLAATLRSAVLSRRRWLAAHPGMTLV